MTAARRKLLSERDEEFAFIAEQICASSEECWKSGKPDDQAKR
jgi:hypothetical protein